MRLRGTPDNVQPRLLPTTGRSVYNGVPGHRHGAGKAMRPQRRTQPPSRGGQGIAFTTENSGTVTGRARPCVHNGGPGHRHGAGKAMRPQRRTQPSSRGGQGYAFTTEDPATVTERARPCVHNGGPGHRHGAGKAMRQKMKKHVNSNNNNSLLWRLYPQEPEPRGATK